MAEGWADPSGAAIPAPMSLEEPYLVIGIERHTATIAELWLRPRGDALEYLPGEYVLLEDRERTVPQRSFSIANAPRPDGLISLLVTRVPDGETSTWVHERLRVGEDVSVSGPYGTFVDDPRSTAPALFLAAGSGLAPIRALLEAALASRIRRELTLIFSARTEDDVVDRERFEQWQAQQKRFRFIRTVTRGAGPPPADGSRRCCRSSTQTCRITMCSSRARPASFWPVRPLPTRSARGANACTQKCSSPNRCRGQVHRRQRRRKGRRGRWARTLPTSAVPAWLAHPESRDGVPVPRRSRQRWYMLQSVEPCSCPSKPQIQPGRTGRAKVAEGDPGDAG